MIVLDENIARQSVLAGLQWYEGKVVSIKTLRPNTVIKDEAIPSLLSKQKQPTFVTTDVSGFLEESQTASEVLHRLCSASRLPTLRTPVPSPPFVSDGRV
jgi:hypothetical protein